MALTFNRSKTKGGKVFSPERNLIESVLGKRTKLQTQSIFDELIGGGFIESTDDLTVTILEEYKIFKSFLPRTDYNKSTLIEAEKILTKYPELITAEEIFYLLNDISEISDAAIYYWFDRVNIKYSSKGIYNKQICKSVVYMAICRKARIR